MDGKTPGEKLSQFIEDNDALFKFLDATKRKAAAENKPNRDPAILEE